MTGLFALSFLLWLLYVHQASADFAGRWMFLPAINALLNGLCAIPLYVGLYFIKHHSREAHRTSKLPSGYSKVCASGKGKDEVERFRPFQPLTHWRH